ncbi:ATP synthase F1 subunit epsilon [bacterium]|nr:ATP synthase F1 subunit epsilon [bacterium]
MPTAELELKVVTPDGEVWAGQATSVVIPGLDGYFGVWRGHAPLVAGMDIGAVLIKTPEEHVVKFIAVTGGFVEVNQRGVTVLAENAEMAEDIDVIRADKALERARERLSKHFSDIDVERAQVALTKALNRKRVAERAKEKRTSIV